MSSRAPSWILYAVAVGCGAAPPPVSPVQVAPSEPAVEEPALASLPLDDRLDQADVTFLRVWHLETDDSVVLAGDADPRGSLLCLTRASGGPVCVRAELDRRHALVASDASAGSTLLAFTTGADATTGTAVELGAQRAPAMVAGMGVAWDGDRYFGHDRCAVPLDTSAVDGMQRQALAPVEMPAWMRDIAWRQTEHARVHREVGGCLRPEPPPMSMVLFGSVLCARADDAWACGDVSAVSADLGDDYECADFDFSVLTNPWTSGDHYGATFTSCYPGGAYQGALSAVLVVRRAGGSLDYVGALPAASRALSNPAWLDRERPIYFSCGYELRPETRGPGCLHMAPLRRWCDGSGVEAPPPAPAPASFPLGVSAYGAFLHALGARRLSGDEHGAPDHYAHVDASGDWSFDRDGEAFVRGCADR